MGHYHVFDPEVVVGAVEWLRSQRLCDWHLVARENRDSKVGNGFTLAFQVTRRTRRYFSILNSCLETRWKLASLASRGLHKFAGAASQA